MALIVQALTSDDEQEIEGLLKVSYSDWPGDGSVMLIPTTNWQAPTHTRATNKQISKQTNKQTNQ
jgi:hypothetical protein